MTQAPSIASGFTHDSLSVVVMPQLFMLIWSTGSIMTKYGVPYAGPVTFLFLRLAGVLVCLLPLVRFVRVLMPRRAGMGNADWAAVGRTAIVDLLMQWGYLTGV